MAEYLLLAILFLPPLLCLFLLATRGKTMLAWTKTVAVFGLAAGILGLMCLVGPCIMPVGLWLPSQLGVLALLGASFYTKREQFMPGQKKRNCAKCGAEMGVEAKFCPGCGAKAQAAATLEKLCAKCGAELGPGQNFCPSCGTKAVSRKSAAVKQFGFCGQCGSRLEEGTRFCAKCGGKVSAKGLDYVEKKVLKEVGGVYEKKSRMPLALKAALAIILIILGYSVYTIFQPRAALLNCEFDIEKVNPTGLSWEGVTLDVTFVVNNPNKVPAMLDSLGYTIYVNNNVRLGTGTTPVMEFPPMQRTRFTASLYIAYSDALKAVWTRIATGGLRYRIEGVAHMRTPVGTVNVPFTKEVGG